MSAEFKYDIQLRDDRIGKYFRKYLNRFIFAEFSEDFINKSKAKMCIRDRLKMPKLRRRPVWTR